MIGWLGPVPAVLVGVGAAAAVPALLGVLLGGLRRRRG